MGHFLCSVQPQEPEVKHSSSKEIASPEAVLIGS